MAIRTGCIVALSVLWFCGSMAAMASDQSHPRIPSFERFYAVAPPKPADEDEEPVKLDPVTGGRLLLGELNCTSCHLANTDAKVRLSAKQAPELDEVGARVKTDWLRAYLRNPQSIKPGTTMPDLIATLPEAERAGSVEALTHFLAATGTIAESNPDVVAASTGATLFRQAGCLACHNSREANSIDLATSAPLPDVGKKYTVSSLMSFLKEPIKFRSSGRMPSLGLTEEEVRSLAHFFVREGSMAPNVKYSLFHGNWNALPKFSDLQPVAEGTTTGFDLSVADRHDDYAIRFVSYLRIAKPDEYRFWLGSNDGSRLIIDDEVVVDNDGTHVHATNLGRATLAGGFHKVVVEYFQTGQESSLQVRIATEEMIRQPLSAFLYLEPHLAGSSEADKSAIGFDASLVAKGRELFATIGCASCHQIKIDGQAVATKLKAKSLTELKSNSGCLAENVTGRAPRFGLSPVQRASLALALKTETEESPAESIHRRLATLNCYACHQRDKIGGVEDVRNATFESLQKEMGDEGRLPPTLTGVGDKLRLEWLQHVLNNGASDRKNALLARMPQFGSKNVESLASLLATVDQRPQTMPKAEFTDPEYRVKAAGRHLVGGQALSCIKCHDFGSHPSTGIRAISLTTMTSRLRVDWFYRYLLDPQVYRRGTRMPAPWPSGQVTIRDKLNADANQQIQAVWSYLSDRDKAAVPYGLVRELIELKPRTEPIIYRNFIEGAGTRAIGVGYPEGVNLAFDANNMRLAAIWHGSFMDASRHWTGRGQGFEPPLGDDIIPLPSRVPFLVLDKPDREFSTELARDVGYRFLGYDLDSKQRPIFRYSMPGLTVEDYTVPAKELRQGAGATLKRNLMIEGTLDTGPLWFLAAVADRIDELDEGRYRIDDVWTMEVNASGSDKPMLRQSVGKQELLVPIRLKNRKAAVSVHYLW